MSGRASKGTRTAAGSELDPRLLQRRAGLAYVPAADLWLDPSRRRRRAFVSHAHGDHMGRHGYTIATPPTADLLAARLPGCRVDGVAEFGQTRREGDADVTLAAAGHILGAAQIHLATEHGTLLYSGDFRLRPSLTAASCETPHCDVLLMECTYGHPRYRFPEREAEIARLGADVRRCLDAGFVPVLLAYGLGKAQEVLAALAPFGFRFVVERAVAAMNEVYERHGVLLPPWERLQPGRRVDDAVVVFPPHRWRSGHLQALGRLRRFALTGWVVGGLPRRLAHADASYAISDHADWDELLEYVERCAPRRVVLTHGDPEPLRAELGGRGIVVDVFEELEDVGDDDEG